MEADNRITPYSQLPLVLSATFAVVGLPSLLVLWLRVTGTVDSVVAGTAIGVVASLVASTAGAALWKKRSGSEMLFSELMLWGWVQRRRNERRMAAASDLLGVRRGRPRAITGGELSTDERLDLLTQLTTSLESGDPYTHGHSRRVARYAATVAKQMGLPREEVAKIRAAGAMHDVGKLDTPVGVLHKEGRLTDEEYAVVKRHPGDGAAMVAILQDDELTAMVRHHHERLDGTGYPDGLRGDDIPLGARILSVADTFDAITSTRPYRKARAHKEALDILSKEAGTQLDPDAVRAFHSCYSGSRPLACWTLLLNLRPRLASGLGAGMSPANAGAAGNVVATAATAAAVGGAVLSPAVMAASNPLRAAADSTPAPVVRAQAPSAFGAEARLGSLGARVLMPTDTAAQARGRTLLDLTHHASPAGPHSTRTVSAGGTTDPAVHRFAQDGADGSAGTDGSEGAPGPTGKSHGQAKGKDKTHGNGNGNNGSGNANGNGNNGNGQSKGKSKGKGEGAPTPVKLIKPKPVKQVAPKPVKPKPVELVKPEPANPKPVKPVKVDSKAGSDKGRPTDGAAG